MTNLVYRCMKQSYKEGIPQGFEGQDKTLANWIIALYGDNKLASYISLPDHIIIKRLSEEANISLKRRDGNKTAVALTKEQYKELVTVIRSGFLSCHPNEQVAAALVLEANLGLRIGDIIRLRLKDIIRDGERYRLDITEEKTEKKRTFTVPSEIVAYLQDYCMNHAISKDDRIFPTTQRTIQRHLKAAADYLEYDNIGTHSFRKFYATNIYVNNNYNIVLVQQLLQHSSSAITQRYIGIGTEELEIAIKNNLELL